MIEHPGGKANEGMDGHAVGRDGGKRDAGHTRPRCSWARALPRRYCHLELNGKSIVVPCDPLNEMLLIILGLSTSFPEPGQ